MFIKNGSFKKHTHIISYVPPTIITQPIGGIRDAGNDFKFMISARGSRPLTYQWYRNGLIITGETSKELNLLNLQVTDNGNYYCIVSNNGHSVKSNTVALIVSSTLSFLIQPVSVQVNKNSNISFNVSVDGIAPITYKWYKNSSIYPGITDTIFINNVTKSEEGNYFVVASNLTTTITSDVATFKINDGIIIKDQPDNTILNVGNNLTLALSCVGTSPISAQWRKNKTNYGALSVTNNGDVKLQISNVQNSDAGNYDCVLSNIVDSVTSNTAIFYINQPATFTVNPLSGSKTVGDAYTFTSNATGTNPISYQWIKENFGNITGATTKDYTLTNLVFANSGKYACIASNLYGTVTSTFASLSVSSNAILFTQLGQDIDGEAANDFSGRSVSMNSAGDRVAIGTPGNDVNGSNSGHVRIYSWNGSSWTQLGHDIDGEAAGDQSGWSVSMNSAGDRVAIGANRNDVNGSNSGHVRIYSWNGTAWTQLGNDIDGEAAGDQSGWSVSMNSAGDRVAIGANRNDVNGSDSGHVRIYNI